jgi:hypothetical protein
MGHNRGVCHIKWLSQRKALDAKEVIGHGEHPTSDTGKHCFQGGMSAACFFKEAKMVLTDNSGRDTGGDYRFRLPCFMRAFILQPSLVRNLGTTFEDLGGYERGLEII